MVKVWRWAAVAAAVIALSVLYCATGFPVRRSHVPVPAADASPGEVVRAYFAAVSANDKATQAALWSTGRRSGINSDHVRSVSGVRVHRQDVYRPLPEDPAELFAYRQHVRVLMTFHVHFWPVHDDPQQPTSTFYLLVRNADRDPWRIWGAGAFV